ncbi:MAG: FecR domain-containing protein [Acidobacteriia bacterium]|nr:FecR domain-containing protein [Terriglobia bacterium]
MKRQLNPTAANFIFVAVLCCYPPNALIHAQHSISTKSGLVSRVQGQVFVQHAQAENREAVSPDLQMMDGDRLATEAMSRAEILVNSAAYLRLDEQAEVRAVNTLLTEARFELLRGMFIIQAGNAAPPRTFAGGRGRTARLDASLAFEVVTPHGILTVGKDGLFRISIEPSATRIDVFEGEIALGGRSEAPRSKVGRVGGGKRVTLTGNHQTNPAITALKLRPFDEFDRWGFPIVRHGVVRRLEGEAFASRGREQVDGYRVSPEFQLREDQLLWTRKASYLELMINRGAYLCLNQLTQIRAVKTETEDAVFELLRGAIIVNSVNMFPERPVKIITPQGTFAVKRGAFARFDVGMLETAVQVRRGGVQNGATALGSGTRLVLGGGTPPARERNTFEKDVFDPFDRWSSGLLRAGTITRYEGKVTLERQGGARLALDKSPPGTRAQLLEGGHLSTERGSRAVLSFGVFSIHVDENSELLAVSTAEPTREFELVRGSAIVYTEPDSAIYSRMSLKISTPHGQADISGGGTFRFDVDSSGTKVKVRSGSLLISKPKEGAAKAGVRLKEKGTAYLSAGAGAPQISRIPDAPDDFDLWSVGARQFPFQAVVRDR